MQPPKGKTSERGHEGELLARAYLEKAGYRTIATNWRCKAGEIDLIMQQKNEIIFAEVRLRRPTSFGAGLDTVAWQKQRTLIRTAQWYLQSTNQHNLSARFDVISIIHEEGKDPVISHIEHAFGVN